MDFVKIVYVILGVAVLTSAVEENVTEVSGDLFVPTSSRGFFFRQDHLVNYLFKSATEYNVLQLRTYYVDSILISITYPDGIVVDSSIRSQNDICNIYTKTNQPVDFRQCYSPVNSTLCNNARDIKKVSTQWPPVLETLIYDPSFLIGYDVFSCPLLVRTAGPNPDSIERILNTVDQRNTQIFASPPERRPPSSMMSGCRRDLDRHRRNFIIVSSVLGVVALISATIFIVLCIRRSQVSNKKSAIENNSSAVKTCNTTSSNVESSDLGKKSLYNNDNGIDKSTHIYYSTPNVHQNQNLQVNETSRYVNQSISSGNSMYLKPIENNKVHYIDFNQ